MPPTPPRRKFTIADGMALTAATGVGLAATRWLLEGGTVSQDVSSIRNVLTRFWEAVLLAQPCLLAWTWALWFLRWLPPKPRQRALRRQPGWVATAIGCLFSLLWLPPIFLSWIPFAFGMGVDRETSLLLTSTILGSGIAASWFTLAVGGRWSRRQDWIDTVGRVLGWYWIATGTLLFWTIALS